MKLSLSNITLLGTSHVSDHSAKEIKEHFVDNPVDIVCVELDKNRYKRMEKEDIGFSVDEILNQIQRIGLPGFVLSAFISFFQRILAFLFNIKPGHDMFTAINCAKKENKKFFFIDQDAEVTLQKFSRAVSIEEILTILPKTLAYSLSEMGRKDTELFTMFDLRKVPSLKMIRLINKRAKMIFPSFYKVIIEDRNKYMAKRILGIAEEFPDAKLLVVIGGGHLEGIAELLKKHFPGENFPKESIPKGSIPKESGCNDDSKKGNPSHE